MTVVGTPKTRTAEGAARFRWLGLRACAPPGAGGLLPPRQFDHLGPVNLTGPSGTSPIIEVLVPLPCPSPPTGPRRPNLLVVRQPARPRAAGALFALSHPGRLPGCSCDGLFRVPGGFRTNRRGSGPGCFEVSRVSASWPPTASGPAGALRPRPGRGPDRGALEALKRRGPPKWVPPRWNRSLAAALARWSGSPPAISPPGGPRRPKKQLGPRPACGPADHRDKPAAHPTPGGFSLFTCSHGRLPHGPRSATAPATAYWPRWVEGPVTARPGRQPARSARSGNDPGARRLAAGDPTDPRHPPCTPTSAIAPGGQDNGNNLEP